MQHLRPFFQQECINKLNWSHLSANPNSYAVLWLLDNPEKIDWKFFNYNSNPIAVNHLMQNHPNQICSRTFSSNYCDDAVEYLIQHPSKIDWNNFSRNRNPLAINFCKQHLDKINYLYMCYNPNPLVQDILNENPIWRNRWKHSPQLLLAQTQPEYSNNYNDAYLRITYWDTFPDAENIKAIEFVEQHADEYAWYPHIWMNPWIFEQEDNVFLLK